jgi:hypothetical protein
MSGFDPSKPLIQTDKLEDFLQSLWNAKLHQFLELEKWLPRVWQRRVSPLHVSSSARFCQSLVKTLQRLMHAMHFGPGYQLMRSMDIARVLRNALAKSQHDDSWPVFFR